MQLLAMGLSMDSGAHSIDIMSSPLFYAQLKFTATNSVGPQWNAVFPLVLLSPTSAFQLISEGTGSWASMEVEGDVQLDSVTGQYGWFYSSSFPAGS
jgi:hypothetical protein